VCQYSQAKVPPCINTGGNIGEGCKWCDDGRRAKTTIQYSDVQFNNQKETGEKTNGT